MAAALGISQATVSRIEGQEDLPENYRLMIKGLLAERKVKVVCSES